MSGRKKDNIISGSKAGGVKLRKTMIEKFGSEEAWREHMRENARKSQTKWDANGRKPRGFAAKPEFARIAGAKGGHISRRRPVEA